MLKYYNILFNIYTLMWVNQWKYGDFETPKG
ncbi:hypothetical protein SAMN06297164_1729 [Nitrosomonas ureae]|uniref:Uncharacterized protein n=1 Tax=Nitrosomonas ureae TaxID=44577 RepID=A0A286A9H1_9PROT|nr:hypothetical protein SAMN06297164_1729 [Nitrosomonas ureae]